MNRICSYFGEDFQIRRAKNDISIPIPHRKIIRREMEKLRFFPYEALIPPKKVLKSLGNLSDGTLLCELRPHCQNQTQYRLPLVSTERNYFLILGFFSRKDPDWSREKEIAEERYTRIKLNLASYEVLDLGNDTTI
jgi:hypothetical protein